MRQLIYETMKTHMGTRVFYSIGEYINYVLPLDCKRKPFICLLIGQLESTQCSLIATMQANETRRHTITFRSSHSEFR